MLGLSSHSFGGGGMVSLSLNVLGQRRNPGNPQIALKGLRGGIAKHRGGRSRACLRCFGLLVALVATLTFARLCMYAYADSMGGYTTAAKGPYLVADKSGVQTKVPLQNKKPMRVFGGWPRETENQRDKAHRGHWFGARAQLSISLGFFSAFSMDRTWQI